MEASLQAKFGCKRNIVEW